MENKKMKTGKQVPAGAKCDDESCHLHGNLRVRGRIFKGEVTKKFPRRIAIEFERMIYVRKYE